MKVAEFDELHEIMCKTALDLSRRKGHDYSGEVDRLKNLKACDSVLEVCTPAQGVSIRLLDKLSRLGQLLKPGNDAQVKDETISDTLLDLINYAVICKALLIDARKEEGDGQVNEEPSR